MKLITYADSNAAKRLTKFLIDKGNAIGVILYLVGIAVYLLLPHEKLVRRQFFDEKALMTGYAKPQYSSSDLSNINQLVENYRHMNKLSVNEWFGRSLQDVGLEVYCQNFTASIPDGDSSVINGTNVYGIIRGRRSPSIEAMVVMATEEDQESNYAVPFLVNMAEYLSNCNFWSKDIIVLLTTNKVFGTQAWLDSYLGLENHIIQSDKLKGKSGAIQSVINIEVPSLGYVEYINIIPNGLNAILPNLDMVFVASNSCAMENLPFSFDNPWRQYLYDDYTKSLLNAAAFLYHQAPGLPFHSHSLFLKHRIDSITLQVVSSPYNTNYEFFRFARTLEAILRSLNNLIERFHHSEFFYFNTAPTAFLSIGQYSPCFALLLAPLVLSSLKHWLLRNTGNNSTYYNRMGIPAPLVLPFLPLMKIFTYSFFVGWLMYFLISLAHVHLPSLSIITLTFLLLSTICVATVCSMYISPSLSIEQYHMSSSIILIFIAITLYGLSLINFSLTLFLTLIYSIPLSLSNAFSNNFWNRLMLIFVFPPLVVIYFCSFYHFLIYDMSLTLAVKEGVNLTFEGLWFSFLTHFVNGSWLCPLFLMYLVPIWFLGWSLTCCKWNTHKDKTE